MNRAHVVGCPALHSSDDYCTCGAFGLLPETFGRTIDEYAALRKAYPHGHPEFLSISIEEIKLHSDKNHDYAKGGPPLGNFERVSAILSLYPNLKLSHPMVVVLVYMLKQFDAVLWGLSQAIEHRVEGFLPRLGDISIYAKIAMCMVKDSMKKGITEASPSQRSSSESPYSDSRPRD